MGVKTVWVGGMEAGNDYFVRSGLFPQTELPEDQIQDIFGGGNADNGVKLGQTFLEVDSQQIAGRSGLESIQYPAAGRIGPGQGIFVAEIRRAAILLPLSLVANHGFENGLFQLGDPLLFPGRYQYLRQGVVAKFR